MPTYAQWKARVPEMVRGIVNANQNCTEADIVAPIALQTGLSDKTIKTIIGHMVTTGAILLEGKNYTPSPSAQPPADLSPEERAILERR